MPDDSPSEPIENTMPNPGPGRPTKKPVLIVLPRGLMAEEAAQWAVALCPFRLGTEP